MLRFLLDFIVILNLALIGLDLTESNYHYFLCFLLARVIAADSKGPQNDSWERDAPEIRQLNEIPAHPIVVTIYFA